MRPDLCLHSFRRAMEAHVPVGCMTHARLFNDEILLEMERYRSNLHLVVSVDSIGEMKGADTAIPYLHMIKRHNIPMTIQYTVHPGNISKMESTFDFLRPLCCKNINMCFRKICESKKFSEDDAKLLLEQSTLINEKALRKGIHVILPFRITGGMPLSEGNYCSRRIPEGRIFTIDIDGTIYPCEFHLEEKVHPIGTVFDGIRNDFGKIPHSPTTCIFKNYGGNQFLDKSAYELDAIVQRRYKAMKNLK